MNRGPSGGRKGRTKGWYLWCPGDRGLGAIPGKVKYIVLAIVVVLKTVALEGSSVPLDGSFAQ